CVHLLFFSSKRRHTRSGSRRGLGAPGARPNARPPSTSSTGYGTGSRRANDMPRRSAPTSRRTICSDSAVDIASILSILAPARERSDAPMRYGSNPAAVLPLRSAHHLDPPPAPGGGPGSVFFPKSHLGDSDLTQAVHSLDDLLARVAARKEDARVTG